MHREDFTDIGTFKGTMASAGCGLLLAALALVLVAAIAGSIAAQAGWNNVAEILGKWPYLLLTVLAVYLALQLFLLMGKPPERGESADRAAESDEPAASKKLPD